MRDIAKVICLCGGEPIESATTDKERQKYGCPYDDDNHGCCVKAYVCPVCETRWVFSLEAPDA